MHRVRSLWNAVLDASWVLWPCRFSVLTIAVGAFVLVFAGQGQEVLLTLAQEGLHRPDRSGDTLSEVRLLRWLWFILTIAFWAGNCWYWARTVAVDLDTRCPPGVDCGPRDWQYTDRQKFLREHTPRALGFFAFFVVALAFAKAAVENAGVVDAAVLNALVLLAVLNLAAGIVFYLFAVKRRALAKLARITIATHVAHDRSRTTLRQLPRETRIVLGGVILVALIMFVLSWTSPVAVGRALGADIVLFLAAATTVPFGTLLAHWGIRHRVPYLGAIVAIGVVGSLWNDNHEVRMIDDVEPPPRAALAADLDAWRGSHDEPGTIVLVATAGGATRAAYWTAMVLGRLQDRSANDFAARVFAISSVSGGSLGAGVFRALLDEQPAEPCNAQRTDSSPRGDQTWGVYESCGKAITQQDFIGPLVAGFLYPDLTQRMIPFPVFPDRAQALEESWETAWENVFAGSNRFAEPLGASPATDDWRPRLLLNGTSVSFGKRLITADTAFDNTIIPNARDLVAMMARPTSAFRWSTAINNSARFPGMEPAGTLRNADGAKIDFVVDGGYYENFGAATAEDLLKTICRGTTACGGLTPIVIQISADPDYRGAAQSLNGAQATPPSQPQGDFLSELLAPVAAFFNARTARGHYAAASLKRRTEAVGGAFYEFRLCGQEFSKSTPLGWWLSPRAFDEIDDEFDPTTAAKDTAKKACREANKNNLEAVLEKLNRT